MSRRKPYAVVHLNDRPVSTGDSRFMKNATLLLTGFMMGIAAMTIVSAIFVQ